MRISKEDLLKFYQVFVQFNSSQGIVPVNSDLMRLYQRFFTENDYIAWTHYLSDLEEANQDTYDDIYDNLTFNSIFPRDLAKYRLPDQIIQVNLNDWDVFVSEISSCILDVIDIFDRNCSNESKISYYTFVDSGGVYFVYNKPRDNTRMKDVDTKEEWIEIKKYRAMFDECTLAFDDMCEKIINICQNHLITKINSKNKPVQLYAHYEKNTKDVHKLIGTDYLVDGKAIAIDTIRAKDQGNNSFGQERPFMAACTKRKFNKYFYAEFDTSNVIPIPPEKKDKDKELVTT